jgi:hypothetical protein
MEDEESSQLFSWYCKHCKRGARAMMSHIQRLNARQDITDQRMKKMEIRVRQLENKSTDSQDVTEEVNKLIDEKVGDAISEYREREARKCNIIVHNLPESQKQTPEDRKQEDEQKVKTMAQHMKVTDIDIRNIIRLGEQSEKPRLTKIHLATVSQKRMMLQNAKLLN